MIWNEAAAAGDAFVMQELSGRPIIDDKAYAANYTKNYGWLGWFATGIQVVTLGSGVVQIMVGAGR